MWHLHKHHVHRRTGMTAARASDLAQARTAMSAPSQMCELAVQCKYLLALQCRTSPAPPWTAHATCFSWQCNASAGWVAVPHHSSASTSASSRSSTCAANRPDSSCSSRACNGTSCPSAVMLRSSSTQRDPAAAAASTASRVLAGCPIAASPPCAHTSGAPCARKDGVRVKVSRPHHRRARTPAARPVQRQNGLWGLGGPRRCRARTPAARPVPRRVKTAKLGEGPAPMISLCAWRFRVRHALVPRRRATSSRPQKVG